MIKVKANQKKNKFIFETGGEVQDILNELVHINAAVIEKIALYVPIKEGTAELMRQVARYSIEELRKAERMNGE